MPIGGSDIVTADLFGDAQPVQAGSLACSVEIAHTMSEAIKAAHQERHITREEVALRMSRYLGKNVSLAMINAYTAESRESHNLSLERAVAFDHATESFALLQLHARKCGAQVLMGRDVLLAELGRIELAKRELSEREKAVRVLARGGR